MSDSAIGRTWEEVEKELFTPEEIVASNLRVALVGELIKARQEKGLTKKEIAKLAGVNDTVISKIERCDDVSIDAAMKVLFALGKTLAIVPLGDKK